MATSIAPQGTQQYRLVGTLPKVGIRPAIDGRRKGVRESLENQTMGMAKSVAQLIGENLRHACGQAVECVIADTCIGGVAEAARGGREVRPRGCRRLAHGHPLLVLRLGNHGHGSAARPRRSGASTAPSGPGPSIWPRCWPGTPRRACRPSASTAATCRTRATREIPDDVREKILRFVRAGLAAATLRGKSYLSLGNVSMGIAGSLVNHDFFEQYLGMRVETVDMVEFVRRIERKIYDEEEFRARLAWVKEHCQEGKDYNAPDNQLTAAEKERAGSCRSRWP